MVNKYFEQCKILSHEGEDFYGCGINLAEKAYFMGFDVILFPAHKWNKSKKPVTVEAVHWWKYSIFAKDSFRTRLIFAKEGKSIRYKFFIRKDQALAAAKSLRNQEVNKEGQYVLPGLLELDFGQLTY